ncbi:MAG: molybdopterin molybdenumtransferase MoeA [Spirochaetaceae bacterium]|nr:MAG: molybdopterin molybdenumtransferase MoeA [Spirochaetaceae bacterium]
MKPHTSFLPHQALEKVLHGVTPLAVEEVTLERALYRVLAEPLDARLQDPRFNKSAVDGIGIRGDDDSPVFEVTAEIAAGDGTAHRLQRGQAVRIMTGAPVPPEVSRVIKLENCSFDGSCARVVQPERISNIAMQGENIRVGQPLLSPRRLQPPDIGVLASQGYRTLLVHRKPRVAVIATGDEIYPADAELPPAGIYDSNSHQLSAFARDAYADVTNLGIVGDSPDRIRAALREAVSAHDVVMLSGGVSMGDLDFVPEALSEIGAETVFHGLAMKPGRPTLYAVLHDAVRVSRIFGLPGNPISTAVQFELLVRPLIWALEGATYVPREAWLPLPDGYRRANAERHEFRPGVYRDGSVVPLAYKGSGHISVLAEATLFFAIEPGVHSVEPGSKVHVRFIR